ncbi:GNAT family N-acetyltransferase [Streptantibioticus ferralitis]|uniref:GNAT family N-acetyltransferase n=1 Tax=Streptantibioticus ferralitis TaxID=236510 RepID=A0ABT5ZAV2_9ACTN|nr:GNAT family N-acetyltransferase [Streptantibioticus ferralitis]MDF2260904.1 GNAT family N-acetyltransferase [Streptantibioticus ferralitis]
MIGNAGETQVLLETPRLVLRRFTLADVPVFAAYRSDPVIARYQAWTAPVPLDVAAAKLREFAAADLGQPGWFQYAVELKADECLIGDVGVDLHENLVQAMLGFTVKADRQRHGYATEAVRAVLRDLFERRGLHRVSAECDTRNLRSARLLERVGFQLEGPSDQWFKDEWTEGFLYGLNGDRWGQPTADHPAGAS